MTKTYQARLERGLQALGYTRDLADRSKYHAFVHPEKRNKLFVGPNGALRSGECASRSFSVGDATRQTPTYQMILTAGDKEMDTKSDYQ